MVSVGNILRSVSSVLFGALLYCGLNWIPVLGPVMVGALSGYWVGGGFKRGFNHALSASVLGTLLVAYVFASEGILEGTSPLLAAFVIWMLLVWNMCGMVICSLAGGLGAIGKDLINVIPKGFRDMFLSHKPKSGLNYVICPVCGQGNLEGTLSCVSCGNTIT